MQSVQSAIIFLLSLLRRVALKLVYDLPTPSLTLSSCNFLIVFSFAFTSPFSALTILSLLLASSSFHSP